MRGKQILEGLKGQINETLLWFCQMDMGGLGYIKKETVEMFAVQNVKFPETLINLVEK